MMPKERWVLAYNGEKEIVFMKVSCPRIVKGSVISDAHIVGEVSEGTWRSLDIVPKKFYKDLEIACTLESLGILRKASAYDFSRVTVEITEPRRRVRILTLLNWVATRCLNHALKDC